MDDDFERRRELRRQKREEMRLEAERMAYHRNEEDEEEAARERRRRARQERMRSKDSEDVAYQPETPELNNSHSVTVTESVSTSVVTSSGTGEGDDEEQALLERLAKRVERRQKRMKEALDRQEDLESSQTSRHSLEESSGGLRHGRSYEPEEEHNSKEEVKQVEEEEEEEVLVEEKPRRSYLREQMEDEDVMRKNKQPNGGVCEDSTPKHKKAERTFSRGSLRSPEAPEADEVDSEDARLEAERKLEELKRRRDEMESEEFERMRQKQQEAEVELEELKRKREERRKVLEEEEQRRKQEEAERKARDEEEKRRMKEEIEKRRAEAAEKRQKVEDSEEGEARKPFKCVSPRGSSLKIGERAEFLNRSAQKSSVKASHAPVVSKIDNRLEQYTSAVQGHKEVRSPRSAAIDLPIVTDGIRNIKSMWEKGNVFSSGGSPASTNKDAAGIKVGVAGRINDWLNKTPETGKTSGGRPADLKPGDVTSKRNLWENKGSSATKVASRGETKSVTNGTGH
ncbi:non-muscle caldesmon-like isoform X3 [Sinocyclocheilus anshuiensis]|uniref:non-muscle caldesmon-like isoform X3 n=1 Tax=Sinocyclocheilus anshuiensis TaxID=1608454 RepID=UPI0007BA3E20|nr:PREDICTED: non-muscle caldesmon-like isoform X3 [Sinocyclocheilus anshuiensis]